MREVSVNEFDIAVHCQQYHLIRRFRAWITRRGPFPSSPLCVCVLAIPKKKEQVTLIEKYRDNNYYLFTLRHRC